MFCVASSFTYMRLHQYSLNVGDLNRWECYNSNSSATEVKWFRRWNYGIIQPIATTKILNFTVHPSLNRNYLICEIQGERASKYLSIKGKFLIPFLTGRYLLKSGPKILKQSIYLSIYLSI